MQVENILTVTLSWNTEAVFHPSVFHLIVMGIYLNNPYYICKIIDILSRYM